MSLYFIDNVTVLRRTLDKWGEPGSATKTGYRGRAEMRTTNVRNQNGEVVVAAGYVLLPATADVDVSDRIALVASSEEIDPEDEHGIITVETLRDFGPKYVKVYLE